MTLKKWLCLIILVAILSNSAYAMNHSGQMAVDELSAVLATSSERMLCADTLDPGDSTSDWIAFAAGRNGCIADKDTYLRGLWKYVSECYQQQGGLDDIKATVWHRISLTVLALGADPTCFGENADGDPIDLIADGIYNWHMTDSLGTQGANAWIYALITLDAGGYEVPSDATYTRQRIIDEILNYQLADGGFHIGSGISDADVTAMALQALAPYYGYDHAVTGSIDRAVLYLSDAQNAQGDFGNGGSESCAQVIIALCALQIDPETDERFCKNGGSALDGLLLYRVNSGGFSHLLGDGSDLLATVQAAQALTALERMRQGNSRLYDFTDDPIEPFEPQTEFPLAVPIAAASAIVVIFTVCILKGRKKCTE